MYEQPIDSGYNYGEKKEFVYKQEHNSGEGAKDQFERMDEERSHGNSIVQVSDPHWSGGGYTLYRVKGHDEKGEFEVEWRFKEFMVFWECITKWFPSFFIPPIPNKVVKNKDKEVLEERAYILNRFLQNLSIQGDIWYSDEVQKFTWP